MHRYYIGVIGITLFALTSEHVTAGMIADCRSPKDPVRQIESCSEIIGSGKWIGKRLAWAHASRAYALEVLGRNEAAIADHDETIRLDPNNSERVLQRARAHGRMGQYALSIADYDRAIAMEPPWSELIIERGEEHFCAKQYEEAISDFQSVIDGEPNNDRAFSLRGLTRTYMGDSVRAMEDFEYANSLGAKNSALSLIYQGRAYARMGRHQEAFDMYGRSIKIIERFTDGYYLPYFFRALALKSLGETDRAIADAEHSMSLGGPLSVTWWQQKMKINGHFAGPPTGILDSPTRRGLRACMSDPVCPDERE